MKKIIGIISFVVLFTAAANAQVLPAKIKAYLDSNFTSAESGPWKLAPGACGGGKAILTGDFNGDGRTDYLVRFITGKFTRDRSLHLIGFINKNADYIPDAFFEDEYTGDMLRSATSIVKKGTFVNSGPSEDSEAPMISLKTDAVAQYICETDQSITYVFKGMEFKNLYPGDSKPDKPIVVQPLVNTASIDPTGTWAIVQNDGTQTPGSQIYIRKRGDNIDIIMDLAYGALGGDRTAIIRNGMVVFTDTSGGSAAIDPTGTVIYWPTGSKWVRQNRSVPPVFATQLSDKWPSPSRPTPNPTPRPVHNPTMSDLSGNWTVFGTDGKVSPSTTGTVTVKDGGLWFEINTPNTVKRATAVMEKGVIRTGWGTTVTLSTDGQVLIWSDGTLWKRQ